MRRGGLGAALALALVATLVSAIHPALLVALPLALLLVALPPTRSPHRIVGIIIVALLFATPVTGVLWFAERGWVLTLGATFLVAVAVRPNGPFLPRGIAAVASATVIGGAVLLVSGAWARIEWALARRFRAASMFWTARLDTAGDPALADLGETMRRIADLEVMLYPAMLALASLAALAAAWWCYRRLIDRNGEALASVREFRFADPLVWVLIAGAALLVLPAGAVASRLGANLATFMAALYVLRGAGIVLALTGVSGLGLFLLVVVAILLLPLVASAALVIGLSDTWLDLRRRRSSDNTASS